MATTTVTQTSTLTLLTSSNPMDPDTDAYPSPTSPTRIVRFDSECVLIPDLPIATKLPLVLTKSYSLPLWKKTPTKNPTPVAPIDEEGGEQDSRARSPTPEDSRIVIKVPIPVFRRRASRSPSPHPRSLSTSPVVPKTLPSCLVHRPILIGLPSSSSSSTSSSLPITPSSSAPLPLNPVRRVSLPSTPHFHGHPSSPSSSKQRDDLPPILTVPLRACCEACEAATEHALAEGDQWKEHFTRGARRRRSASLESYQSFSSSPPHQSLLNRTFSPPPPSAAVDIPRTFASLSSALDDSVQPHSSLHMTRGGAAAVTAFALRVDEVDQRRRPFSFSNEEGHYAALRAAGVGGSGPGEASTSGASSTSSSGSSTSGPSTSGSRSPSAQKQPLYQAARRASAPRGSTNPASTSSAASSSSSPPPSYLSSSPSSYTSPYSLPATYPNAQDALLVVPDAYRLRASPIAEEDSEDGGSRRSSVSMCAGSIKGGMSGTPPLIITGTTTSTSTRSTRTPSARPPEADDDDEAQLFPLPRRSPSSSPSPRASPVPSLRGSPSLGYSPSASVSSLLVPPGGMTERKSSGGSVVSVSGTRGRLSPLAMTEREKERGKQEQERQMGDGKDVEEMEEVLGASLSRRVSADPGVRVDAARAPQISAANTTENSANTSADNAKAASSTASNAVVVGAERRTTPPKGPRPSLAAARRDKDKDKEPDAANEKAVSAALSTSASPPAAAPTPMAGEDGKDAVASLPAGAAMPVDVHAHHFHIPSFHHHAHARSESTTSSALSDSSSTMTTTAHPHIHTSTPSTSPPPPTTTMSASPPAPASPMQGRRKPSFTFAAPLARAGGVLRGAGADVLRGVSAMGSGMGASV